MSNIVCKTFPDMTPTLFIIICSPLSNAFLFSSQNRSAAFVAAKVNSHFPEGPGGYILQAGARQRIKETWITQYVQTMNRWFALVCKIFELLLYWISPDLIWIKLNITCFVSLYYFIFILCVTTTSESLMADFTFIIMKLETTDA